MSLKSELRFLNCEFESFEYLLGLVFIGLGEGSSGSGIDRTMEEIKMYWFE